MKKRKYKATFERDYTFYYEQRHVFTFAGTDIKSNYDIQFPGEDHHIDVNEDGTTLSRMWKIPYLSHAGEDAKRCFFLLDSEGRRECCREPELLVELLTCKAAINLQIRIWAESRAEYTLSFYELQEMMTELKCPDWVLKAVENQKSKILKEMVKSGRYKQHRFFADALAFNLAERLNGQTDI